MTISYAEMKEELAQELPELQESGYPEDGLTQIAEGYVPAYTNDIISEWQKMPHEYNDGWMDYGVNAKEGIVALMTTDLHIYYEAMITKAYKELTEGKEDE